MSPISNKYLVLKGYWLRKSEIEVVVLKKRARAETCLDNLLNTVEREKNGSSRRWAESQQPLSLPFLLCWIGQDTDKFKMISHYLNENLKLQGMVRSFRWRNRRTTEWKDWIQQPQAEVDIWPVGEIFYCGIKPLTDHDSIRAELVVFKVAFHNWLMLWSPWHEKTCPQPWYSRRFYRECFVSYSIRWDSGSHCAGRFDDVLRLWAFQSTVFKDTRTSVLVNVMVHHTTGSHVVYWASTLLLLAEERSTAMQYKFSINPFLVS